MKPVATALFGYGHLGRWHAQKVEALSESELVAIVEHSVEGRERAQLAHPSVNVVASMDELPAHTEAVIIATPTSTHYELCLEAIKRNLHIFCEKPITDKLEDALKIHDLTQGKSLVFQAGHSERCHQAWERLQEFAAYLAPGAHIRLDRYAPFKGRATDVDVVNDLMIHDLDLVCFLLGAEPVRLRAQGFKQRTRHYDHAIAELEWSNGTRATITVGRGHVHEVRALEASSSAGLLRVDLMHNKIQIAKGDGDQIEVIDYPKRDHLLIEQQAFYNAIRGARDTMVTLDDGVAAVRLVDAVLRSLDSGKMVELS